MANITEKIESLDLEDINVRSINNNRKFVEITYDSDLDNDSVEEIFTTNLDETLFAINFTTNSPPDSQETVKVMKFRVK